MTLGIHVVLLQGPSRGVFLMCEVPLYTCVSSALTPLPAVSLSYARAFPLHSALQGYLVHKKTPTPLGP